MAGCLDGDGVPGLSDPPEELLLERVERHEELHADLEWSVHVLVSWFDHVEAEHAPVRFHEAGGKGGLMVEIVVFRSQGS